MKTIEQCATLDEAVSILVERLQQLFDGNKFLDGSDQIAKCLITQIEQRFNVGVSWYWCESMGDRAFFAISEISPRPPYPGKMLLRNCSKS